MALSRNRESAAFRDARSRAYAVCLGEETPFAEEAHYEEIMPGDDEWQDGWRLFERTIKSEARFSAGPPQLNYRRFSMILTNCARTTA